MKNNMTTGSDIEGTSNKRLVPKLRFPEFRNDGGWKEVILGEAFERISEKNVNNNRNVLTISAQYGLVSQYDYFNKNVAAENIRNYYFIHKGDFVYNKSRSQGYPFGVIKPMRRYESGVVSTLYICFRAKTNCCIDFYEQYFDTDLINNELSKIAQEGARNHGLLNMSVDDFFNKIKLLVPHSSEREKVAGCLLSIDEEISALKEQVEQLKAHKKGLIQKLFPVAGKFVPELRFPEFEKDWDVDSMQSIFDMKNGYTPSKSNPIYWDNGTIPWFRMEDIRKNGHILSDSIQHVTQQAVKNSGLFPAYSIIVATTATIGEHALIIVDSLANQQFTFLTKRKSFKDKINMIYFHHYMFIIDEWCKNNTNSGGLVSVNMPAFKQLLIPFPCPAEQKKIAECLSSIDELISLYENKVTLLEQHKKGLMQRLFPNL